MLCVADIYLNAAEDDRLVNGVHLVEYAYRAALASEAFDTIVVRSEIPSIVERAKALGALTLEAEWSQTDPLGFAETESCRHYHNEDAFILISVNARFPVFHPELCVQLKECLLEDKVGTVPVVVPLTIPEFSTETSKSSPTNFVVSYADISATIQTIKENAPTLSTDVGLPIELPSQFLAPRIIKETEPLDALIATHAYRPATKPIKLLILDVDGVMTDGAFYYGPTGQALKKFSTRDGHGIKLLQKSGIEVGVITGEKSGFAESRTKDLGITRAKFGCLDKLPVFEAWREEIGIGYDEIAYMGDDLPDIPCLEKIVASGCPADAQPEVKPHCRYVSTINGGDGAIRDFIRFLGDNGFVTMTKDTH